MSENLNITEKSAEAEVQTARPQKRVVVINKEDRYKKREQNQSSDKKPLKKKFKGKNKSNKPEPQVDIKTTTSQVIVDKNDTGVVYKNSTVTLKIVNGKTETKIENKYKVDLSDGTSTMHDSLHAARAAIGK